MIPLDVLGQRQVFGTRRLGQQARELLGVERVAAGALEQRPLQLRREDGTLEQAGEQPRRLLVRERRDRERQRVRLPSSPPRAALQELGPSRADDEQRHARAPVDEVVDEVEEVVIGPVQILEDEHRRMLFCERLEDPAPCSEPLGAISAGLAVRTEPDERAQILEESLRALGLQGCDRLLKLVLRLHGRVRVEDSRMRLRHPRRGPSR
jgi:hypothetical protein